MKKVLDFSGSLCIIIFVPRIEDLCNGSTPDSDSVCGGSNPSSSAIEITLDSSESRGFFLFSPFLRFRLFWISEADFLFPLRFPLCADRLYECFHSVGTFYFHLFRHHQLKYPVSRLRCDSSADFIGEHQTGIFISSLKQLLFMYCGFVQLFPAEEIIRMVCKKMFHDATKYLLNPFIIK